MNTFGRLFRLTSFGESHGPVIGGVINGMPSGIDVDLDFIQSELNRRRPGQCELTTSRDEADKIEILSGVFDRKTTGCPIGFIVKNTDHHTSDYYSMKDIYRPSHADLTYQEKYGIRDYRGGGRASARATISMVVGGAFAKLVLDRHRIDIVGYVSQVGDVKVDLQPYEYPNIRNIENSPVRCPEIDTSIKMCDLIKKVREEGDTIGGKVTCMVRGCPIGIGEPIFGKLQSQLASAMFAINAVKGFEYGEGFHAAEMRGSDNNDQFSSLGYLRTNHDGGIQGGISNGNDIYFSVAFKPVPTIFKEQTTIDKDGNVVKFIPKGRHDPCVVMRAVPIVEAMTAMTILDNLLIKQSYDKEKQSDENSDW